MDLTHQNFEGSEQGSLDLNIHVRCPDCFKLYAVKASEIHESRPQFQCAACTAQFWIPYPECLENAAGLIGFPVENIREPKAAPTSDIRPNAPAPESSPAMQAKPFSCPKCGAGYSGGQTECEKCGVLFEKFISKKNAGPARSDFSASKELKALWEAVILEYEKEDRHRAFIRFGFTDNNIEYVTRKYADVLSSNPSDEMALKFQKEITAQALARMQTLQKPSVYRKGRGWQDWSIPRLRFSPLLYVIAAALIAAGLIVPGMRNLVGFGCSLLFMTFMVKFYFQSAKTQR